MVSEARYPELYRYTKLVYLASRYSTTDGDTNNKKLEANYLKAVNASHALFRDGWLVYSPIVMCHPMAMQHTLPKDHIFWKQYNHNMLKKVDMLVVLMDDIKPKSMGVEDEIRFALENKIPIRYMRTRPNKEAFWDMVEWDANMPQAPWYSLGMG